MDTPHSTPIDEPSRPDGSSLPDEAWLVALASLPAMGPRRLGALTAGRTARRAWDDVCHGRGHLVVRAALAQGDPDAPVVSPVGRAGADLARASDSWARQAADVDVARLWEQHRRAAVTVVGRTTGGYPSAAMDDDPLPAAVLFAKGDLRVIAGPRVAIVGTRDCTHQGHDFAFELGRDLASSGVRVVSGLALGIDGAAHAGALEAAAAPPVAVVGSGLDIVYPRRHGSLWRAVASRGLLLSEHPLGVAPTAWHFPARNRLIAALADVVVVVESHERGGSLQTAREALVRNREVMAVPGPVRSNASSGANLLLRDGAGVCLGADDVLALLGLSASAITRSPDHRGTPGPVAAALLAALGGRSGSLEQLVLRTGLTPAQVASGLHELEDLAWIVSRGGWYEPVGRPP